MSNDANNIDIEMELTVKDTLQRILNKIDDTLDMIDGKDDRDDEDRGRHGEPPKDVRCARVINELSQSYAFLSRYDSSQKNSTL